MPLLFDHVVMVFEAAVEIPATSPVHHTPENSIPIQSPVYRKIVHLM
jgi:hypothetical protein